MSPRSHANMLMETSPLPMHSKGIMVICSKWYTKSVSSTFKQRLALTLGAKQNQRTAKQW